MRQKRTRTWVLIGTVACGVALTAILGPTLIYRAILWAWTGQTHDVPLAPPPPIEQIPQGISARRLGGHKGATRALAFFPDGKQLASAGDDHIIRIWDLERHTSRAVEGHDGPVYALAVSPDGTRMLSGGADLVARLWDVSSGKALALLEGHTAAVRAVAFLPHDRALTAGDDGTLRLWDLRDEQQLKELEGHANAVAAMSTSADGTEAASIDTDGVVCLWDLNRCERVWTFRPAPETEDSTTEQVGPPGQHVQQNVPPALLLSPDGHTLWTLYGGSEAATVGAWDVATRKPLAGWDASLRADYIGLSPDAQHLLLVSGDEASVFKARSAQPAEYQARVNNPTLPPEETVELFQSLATQPAADSKDPPEAVRKLFGEMMRQAEKTPHPCAAALSADGNRVAVGLRRGIPLLTADPRNAGQPTPGGILVFDRPH